MTRRSAARAPQNAEAVDVANNRKLAVDRHREVAIKINHAGRAWQTLRREIERAVRGVGGRLPDRREIYTTGGIDKCVREAEAALPDLDGATPAHYARAEHLTAVVTRMIEMETHRLRAAPMVWLGRRFDPDEVAKWRRSGRRRQAKEAVVS